MNAKPPVLKSIIDAFGYFLRYNEFLFIGKPAQREVLFYRGYIEKYLKAMKIDKLVYLWELLHPLKYGLEAFTFSHYEVWFNILYRLSKEDFSELEKKDFKNLQKQIQALFTSAKLELKYDAKNDIYKLTNLSLSLWK